VSNKISVSKTESSIYNPKNIFDLSSLPFDATTRFPNLETGEIEDSTKNTLTLFGLCLG
jgi:hypothetical protein